MRWRHDVHRAITPRCGDAVPIAFCDRELPAAWARFSSAPLFRVAQTLDEPLSLQSVLLGVSSALAAPNRTSTVSRGIIIQIVNPCSGVLVDDIENALHHCNVLVSPSAASEGVFIPVSTVVRGPFLPGDEHLVGCGGVTQFYGRRSDCLALDQTLAVGLLNGDALCDALQVRIGKELTASAVMGVVVNLCVLAGVVDAEDVSVLVASISAVAAARVGVPLPAKASRYTVRPLQATPRLPLHVLSGLFSDSVTTQAVAQLLLRAPVYDTRGTVHGAPASLLMAPWRSPFGAAGACANVADVLDALTAAGVDTPLWSWETAPVVINSIALPVSASVVAGVVVVVVLVGSVITETHAWTTGPWPRTYTRNVPWPPARRVRVAIVSRKRSCKVITARWRGAELLVCGVPTLPGRVAVI